MIKYTIAFLFIIGTAMCLYAFSGGIIGTTRKNGDGCNCHGTNVSSEVIVSISGPDTMQVNDSANFFITLSGGPLIRGGTNIASRKALLIPGLGLRTQNGELTHVNPFTPQNNKITFKFKYKAPSITGIDTLYANGNSVNFDGFSVGDEWNFASDKKVVIVNSTGIINLNSLPDVLTLHQNYPNPFNPITNIIYQITNNNYVSLKIYDALGKDIMTLVSQKQNAGTYEIVWNGINFPTGTYYCKLSAGDIIKINKMLLIK